MLKKIAVFLLSGLSGLLPAASIPLTPQDFVLGSRVIQGVPVNTSFQDGIYRVEVKPVPNMTNATRGTILLNIGRFRGQNVRFKAEMRPRGITPAAENRFAGGKMLAYVNNSGSFNFFVSSILNGTREEWTPMECYCPFPANPGAELSLTIGLQQASGVLEFRNPCFEVAEFKKLAFRPPEGFQCPYTPRVTKNVPRRGVMSPAWEKLTEKDIEDLAAWNANLIRFQIVDGLKNPLDTAEYEAWFSRAIARVKELTPLLQKHHIQIIFDMHNPPGSRYSLLLKNPGAHAEGAKKAKQYSNPGRFVMMEEAPYREFFLKMWRKAARELKGNPVIYGFDLCNEPDQYGPANYDWWNLQYDAAKAIREIDSEVPILVEGNYMSKPTMFEMTPMPFPNILYSIHMYIPMEVTHQGADGSADYGKKYPASAVDYAKSGWDKEKLRKAMQQVIDFQKKYGAKIQVGEFSTTIWTPGGASYLAQVTELFEEYGWDWTYHAFREWKGWSLEHEGSPLDIRPSQNNDRKEVILKALKKNGK